MEAGRFWRDDIQNRNGNATHRQPLSAIGVVLLLGFCAGMQLGKIAPVVGYLEDTKGYSMTTVGWLTSLIGLFVALAALPAAGLIDRSGTVRSLKIGAVVLVVGALMLAFVDTLTLHLIARSVEALGYLLLVIAAPAYLATTAAPDHRPMILALWGSFVPVGYALANLQEEFVTAAFGQAAYLTSAALPLLVFTLATLVMVQNRADAAIDEVNAAGHPSAATDDTSPLRNAMLLAAGFGIYVLLQMGFFTFLPAFADTELEPEQLSPAAVALFVPAGNLTAALSFSILPARRVPAVAVAAFALSAVCAAFLFRTTTQTGLPVYAGFAFLGGILVSSVFASVPQAVSARWSAAIVVGLIAQAGGLGTVGGPPLAGFLLDRFGWSALTWMLTALSILGTVAMLPLLRATRHDRG